MNTSPPTTPPAMAPAFDLCDDPKLDGDWVVEEGSVVDAAAGAEDEAGLLAVLEAEDD